MQHNPHFERLVNDARNSINEIDVHHVKKLMDQDQLPLFLDVREDREWHVGHLPMAHHMGRGIIERDIENKVPDKTTPIILYCGGGYRSILAAESLQKMGYTHVQSMAGGYRGWKEASYPLIQGNAVAK